MADPITPRLILASTSPARRELLTRSGFSFEIMPSSVDEPTTGFANPRTMVKTISWLKAAAVAPKVETGIVIAADTIGWINGKPILKPTDETDARRILAELGGREHELWTGVVLWRRPDDLQLIWQERSLVHFAVMTQAETDAYLSTRAWKHNSGAYAIEEIHDPYVKVVDGSVSNVIGLPMESLKRALAALSKI